jgi:hypothetical protein
MADSESENDEDLQVDSDLDELLNDEEAMGSDDDVLLRSFTQRLRPGKVARF